MPYQSMFAMVILALVSHGLAHSNVERLMRIAPNGTMVGKEGFPRGFINRESKDYSDGAVGWLIPPNGRSDGKIIHANDTVASPSQQTANYTDELPMLVASPGDIVALQYQENGHVTLPQNQANKPANRGTIYIYGTTDLAPGAPLLDILYQWTADGTGGNGKGRLLATRNFDDGQCYQINDGDISKSRVAEFAKEAETPMGANLWCQSDVALPSDLVVGKAFTLIWIWDWPTMDRPDVKFPPSSAPGAALGPNGEKVITPEIYTTVMDVQIVDPCDDSLGEAKGSQCKAGVSEKIVFAKGQDLNLAAVAEQLTNNFLVDVSSISGASNASATSNAPASSSTHCTGRKGGHHHTKGSHHGKIKTETVYADIQTVTVTTTVAAPEPTAAGTGSSAASIITGAPSVSAFLRAARVRREPGAWRYNRGE